MEAEASRRKLWGIAYRVTGCAADADEIVQDAYTRLVEVAPRDDRPVEAWLVTVTTRLAIDRLRRRRETPYDGPWLPSPLVEPESGPEGRYADLEDATFAYLLALEALTPDQRAALVLRDVFDLPAREVGVILACTEENVRTLHRRARARLAEEPPRPAITVEARRKTEAALQAFFGCIAAGDAEGALALLAADATTLNDGGGTYHAARKPVVGAARVLRLWTGLLGKRGPPSSVARVLVNGLPAVDARFANATGKDAPRVIMGAWLGADAKIAVLFAVLAPAKLRHLRAT